MMVSYFISVKILYVKHLVQRLIHGKHSSNIGYYTVIKLIKINPEYSLEGLMLKLKFQYFDHLMQRWLIGKDSEAGKDWGQEKGVTRNEMVGWRHWLNGHESEQAPGDSEGQGNLACCSLWGHKESDTTEQQQLMCYSTNLIYSSLGIFLKAARDTMNCTLFNVMLTLHGRWLNSI